MLDLSSVSSRANDGLRWLSDLPSPLVQYIIEHAGISETKAKMAVALVASGAGLIVWKLLFSSSNMPPGPRPLPLIGNLHNMGIKAAFYTVFADLRKKYGDIYTVHLGPMKLVALNTPELVREAFIRQGAKTSNRPYSFSAELSTKGGQDIICGNYCPRVQMQRKLAHQALRRFSLDNNMMAILQQALDNMAAQLEENPNLDASDMAYKVSYCILFSMCFGKKITFDDAFFLELITKMKDMEKEAAICGIIEVFPILRFFPFKLLKTVKETINIFEKYNEEAFEEHKATFDKDKLTDFTYHLVNAMKEAEENPEDKSNLKLLTKTHFSMVLHDMFFAGTDTTRHTLNWIWHYLAAFPEVQERARQEVDDVIGRDGMVSTEYKDQLPYLNAVIHEILRIRTVAPMGVMHVTTEDIKLGGYDLPKGTTLFSNTWSILLDERYWDNPEAFLPERWLDEQGLYQFQQGGFIPFSMGRRSCIGESFVKVELLLFTAMLLQAFTLEPTPGYRVTVEIANSMITAPMEQKPIVVKRRV